MNVSKARELRKNLTESERALWKHLRKRQLARCKFRRQQPIGAYILDFVSFERKVIVEVDGGQHSQQVDYDAERTAWLEAQGYRVLRFWNNQVLEEVEAVKAGILKVLESELDTPHLNPPPQGGRRSGSLPPLRGKVAQNPFPPCGGGWDKIPSPLWGKVRMGGEKGTGGEG